MSRDYISDPNEDAAFSLRDIRDLLERIADALESIVPVLVDPAGPPTLEKGDES